MEVTVEKLRQYQIKATKPRVAILELFHGDCQPMNAEQALQKLRKSHIQIDLATVYRALTLFSKAGLLNQVHLRTGSVSYELKDQNHHHHHIVCTDCGATEHFDVCIADSVTKKVLGTSKKFSMVTEHVLELFGVCKACLPKVKKS